jgi:hypothetical protein
MPGEDGAAASKSRQEAHQKRLKDLVTVIGVVTLLAAIAVSAVSTLSLVLHLTRSPQIAAPFTRVGGVGQTGTAVDASRFWLTPPRTYVEIEANESQGLTLRAGLCAAFHNVPLLYHSPVPERDRMMHALVTEWSRRAGRKIKPIWITRGSKATRCLKTGNRADIRPISTLRLADPVVRIRGIGHLTALASVVVFAAPLAPGDAPDVAVGLALAAHMARMLRSQVSLVVVPRYLEADPALETALEDQHVLVTGGVVLGQVNTVPADTRVLLRELLSPARGDLLSELEDSLESIGPLTSAALALLGLGGAAAVSPVAVPPLWRAAKKSIQGARQSIERLGDIVKDRTPVQADLTRLAGQKVTVWLRSGWEATGTVPTSAGKGGNDPIFEFLPLTTEHVSQNSVVKPARSVLIPITDIEMVAIFP